MFLDFRPRGWDEASYSSSFICNDNDKKEKSYNKYVATSREQVSPSLPAAIQLSNVPKPRRCPQKSCIPPREGCSNPQSPKSQHFPGRLWLQDGSNQVTQGWLGKMPCAPTQNPSSPELSAGLRRLAAGICVWVQERFYLSWVLSQQANILCLKRSLCVQIPARPTR